MRELRLEACQPKPWRFSLTERDGQEHDIPHLLNRHFTAGVLREKMVRDITYIPTSQGCLHRRLRELVAELEELSLDIAEADPRWNR